MKTVVSACLHQILKFDNKEEFNIYRKKLDKLKRKYIIDSKDMFPDGGVSVHIRKQANDWDIGDFFK